jgi:uncharacterized protein (TIGR03118 family)
MLQRLPVMQPTAKIQTCSQKILALGKRSSFFSTRLLALLLVLYAMEGCKKGEVHFALNGYEKTILVSDTMGFGAEIIDPNLVNAWGLAVAPSGPIWISDNNSGMSTIYTSTGMTVRPAVTIPAPGAPMGGTPTGVIFNSTADFMILSGKLMVPSKFIFATEDGTIIAWAGGNEAAIGSDQSLSGAVYKGIAMGQNGGSNFLFATNFHAGRIDVFDKNFMLVPGTTFNDPNIPAGFAPFNIRNMGGWLYVTYAKQKPDRHDDMAGPGNGFVDIFKTDGSLITRFASQGALNSPWGIVQARSQFFKEMSHVILVGNFGDGRINVFGPLGEVLGPLKDDGHPITIDGLWSLENEVPGTDSTQLFFTAGPVEETHGVFGFLQRRHG